MNVIDLCAGIGGMSLGFERAGFRTIAFCEIDERCRAVLGKHWPSTPVYPDARDHACVPLPGSFGSGEARGAVRLSELTDVQSPWIVTENVHHSWKRWVPELRRCLHTIGYASLPLHVSAVELGARHPRRRVFVVAHADSEQLRKLSWWWQWQGRQVADELAKSWDSAPRRLGAADGVPGGVHRRKQLGNAIVPYVAELVARGIREVLT